ncbi:MAG: putative Ig domain-containing protein [Tissierellia bacterium]|nr:putative Ig domain-containing protein [Tissierellia bacterium]
MSKNNRRIQHRIAALLLAFMMVFAGLPILGLDTVQAAGESMENPIDLTFVATATPGTVDGNVWIDTAGLTGAQDSYEPGLVGVPLIIQWQDADGSMSPFYRTYTREGGLYRVYLPEFTDAFGNTHKWRAGGATGYPSQKIRVQVDPDWLANDPVGKTLQVTFDWLHGNFGGVEDATGPGWLYAKGPAAERIEGYYITLQPKDRMHYHLPEDQWVEKTTPAYVAPVLAGRNSVRGKVYWDWQYTPYLNANPEDNARDVNPEGVDVLLTIYDKNDETKKIITYHTKTNAEGQFLFDLGSGIPSANPDKDLRKMYVSIIPPEFANDWSAFGDRGPMNAGLITRGASGHADGATNYVFQVRFALIPRDPKFDVLEYDTISNFASPGTEVQTFSSGLNPDSGPYKITWTNKNTGEMVKEYVGLVPMEDGTISGASYTVPNDLSGTTIFEAVLSGPEGRAIGRDGFVVAVADADLPIGAVGTPYSGQVNSPGITDHVYKYAVDPATPLPNGLLFDENTGAITGTPVAGTAGVHAINLIVTGKGPATDSPEYKMIVKETLYIFDANVSGVGMEDNEIKGKANIDFAEVALPAGTTLTREVIGLPSDVQFVDAASENLVNKPAIDDDKVTTEYKLGVKYTFKYPDPKVVGQFITETVTQAELVDPLKILEKFSVAGGYPDGYTGIAYESEEPIETGGEGPYTYALAEGSEWPDGLTLNPGTGQITGTPTTQGTYDVSLVVTENNGYTTTLDDTIVIKVPPQPLVFITSIATDNIVNLEESSSLTVPVTGTVFDAKMGDTVTIYTPDGGFYTGEVIGGLSYSIDVPGASLVDVNGKPYEIRATVVTKDELGKEFSASTTGSYEVDLVAPSAPTVSILMDANDDGKITPDEKGTDAVSKVDITLPADAVQGDKLKYNYDGSTVYANEIEITAEHIAAGKITIDSAEIGDHGSTLTVAAVVVDQAGNPSQPGADNATIVTAPSAKPIEPKQDFYTDSTNTDHQVVTGKIEGFTPEMVTDGTKVTLVDAETGKPRFFADPDDLDPDTGLPKQKPIEGFIKPDGTFEIPIGMDEIKHLDEVKVELAEPDKIPTLSDDKVIIDKLAPSIENPTANKDAGVVEVKATTDDPKGVFVIQVGDQYYGANVDEVTGEIFAQYPATQEGTPKILAQDEFGNLRDLDVTVVEKEAFTLQVSQTYAGNRRILMRSQIPYASIHATVVSGDQRIELPIAQADDVGRLTISLNFRLKAGDVIESYAEFNGVKTDIIKIETE